MPTSEPFVSVATPLHDKVWVGWTFDDDRGRLVRPECACGLDMPWIEDSELALQQAREHRDEHRARA